MKKRTASMGFWVMTAALVLTTAFLCAGTAVSSTDADAYELEQYYAEKERELVSAVRVLLQREGMENSGVMVTRVVEDDGSRCYTVAVHHGKIGRMSDAEREELLRRLEALDFEGEGCSFSHEFL